MRFRPEQHLHRPSEIRGVREQGRRLECGAFTLWWRRRDLPNVAAGEQREAKIPTARVCVIASTAAVGNAVHRNRAKRRLREMYRHQQTAVPSDCDLLLIARRAVNQWPLVELEQRFMDACGKIGPVRKPA